MSAPSITGGTLKFRILYSYAKVIQQSSEILGRVGNFTVSPAPPGCDNVGQITSVGRMGRVA